MEGKGKLAAAVAACALLVVVASTAARCAVAHVAGEAGGGEAAAQEAEGGDEAMDTAGERALAALMSREWHGEADAARTVAFRDGSFVEADGSGAHVTAFDVVGSSESEDRCSLTVKLVRDGGAGPVDSEIVLEGREGSLKVSCDGFAGSSSYVEGAGSGGEVAVTGLPGAYVDMAGGDEGAVREAVSSYCRAHVPAARSASFDGEVYLDMRDGRVVATFHCDDPARTILTVTYAGGEFTVMG